MAENKTQPTTASVTAFLNRVQDTQKRNDCFAILKMMRTVSRKKPVMWGSSIVGFGKLHYVYESGREGDTGVIGFSPRKQSIAIYVMCSLQKVRSELLKLGKHKAMKSCLHIKSLSDVDTTALRKVLTKAYREAQKQT